MTTEDLIQELAGRLTPVSRVPSPFKMLQLWVAVTLAVLAAVVGGMGPLPNLAARVAQPSFALQEMMAAATALLAAYGAFCAGRPDQPGWKLWLPFGVAAVWAAALGRQCLLLALRGQGAAWSVHLDFMCVPAILASGLPSALVTVWLLRQGEMFRPAWACLCGALASAAAAEAALRLYHPEGTLATMLVWQMGSVVLFTFAGGGMAALSLPRLRRLRPI
ncbi:MAG: hypothetical protein B7Z81_04750 [Acidocella sp. 20-61-6]|nr:MAG: hypothetical protein B7Z81_04750 [Acidocella sp. 20-61-6]